MEYSLDQSISIIVQKLSLAASKVAQDSHTEVIGKTSAFTLEVIDELFDDLSEACKHNVYFEANRKLYFDLIEFTREQCQKEDVRYTVKKYLINSLIKLICEIGEH